MSLYISETQTLDLRNLRVSFLDADDDDILVCSCHDFDMSAPKILKEIIEDKKRVNPRLSLRAIAAKMEISSGRLSEILSEKRPLTEHYLEKISHALKLSVEDTTKLRRALQQAGDDDGKRSFAHLLNEQEITVLSDWKSYALLSFFQTSTYKDIYQTQVHKEGQFAKIAQRMGLPSEEIRNLLNIMNTAKLIKWADGKWQPELQSTMPGFDIPHEAAQERLAKDLDLAKEKLQELEVFAREFSSMTLVMDHKDLAKAKKLIRTFRRNFAKSLEHGQKKEVYQLSLQLFPLTKNSDGDKN